MYKRFIKRLFDIVLSFIGIIILLIPFAVIAVIIKCDSKGPVFFRQKRVGKDKKLFSIVKFRTMSVNAPSELPTGDFKNSESYMTKWQKFMRKMSIDELPQLFNIFVGQMSIIGPRPVLWNQENLISERDKYGANDVRPGLTGWAQINGRDEIGDEEKARLDGEYVRNLSFAFDAKCFFRTVVSVLKSDGVSEGGPKNGGKDGK